MTRRKRETVIHENYTIEETHYSCTFRTFFNDSRPSSAHFAEISFSKYTFDKFIMTRLIVRFNSNVCQFLSFVRKEKHKYLVFIANNYFFQYMKIVCVDKYSP